MEDLSQRPPAPRAKASVLDRHRPLIESWLDEDERNWRKQGHTARRIWDRLRDKAGADVAESTVRNYVRRIKLERGASREQYLDLEWEQGDAQADFGGPTSTSPAVFRQADFSIPQIKNDSISPQVTKEIILTFVFATRIIATYPHFHDT